MFEHIKKICVALSVVLASSAGYAENKACLLEGSFTLMGFTTEIKDCLQNEGVPQAQFLESCHGIANAATAMGAPPAKITYLAACPAGAQGACEGLFGSQLMGFYYKRDAQSLADAESGCVAQGGKWRKG